MSDEEEYWRGQDAGRGAGGPPDSDAGRKGYYDAKRNEELRREMETPRPRSTFNPYTPSATPPNLSTPNYGGGPAWTLERPTLVLVLGILSITCFGPLTAIPALIIAARSRPLPFRAKVGVVLATLTLVGFAIAILLLALSKLF